jgi:hypothetical protein
MVVGTITLCFREIDTDVQATMIVMSLMRQVWVADVERNFLGEERQRGDLCQLADRVLMFALSPCSDSLRDK